jgi:hypothetical protein
MRATRWQKARGAGVVVEEPYRTRLAHWCHDEGREEVSARTGVSLRDIDDALIRRRIPAKAKAALLGAIPAAYSAVDENWAWAPENRGAV